MKIPTRRPRFNGRKWILLFLLSAMLMACVACSRGMKPRKHFWQLWRPKSTEIAEAYRMPNPDLSALPPPPEIVPPESPDGTRAMPGDIPPPPQPIDVTQTDEPETYRGPAIGPVSELQMVHFGYNSSELDAEAHRVLDGNARWIQEHPNLFIQIEGHCDERGTNEYNLNLGMRRARAVRAYLISKSVSPNVLSPYTYGEERPVDPAHNESAWGQNRRVQFLVAK